MHTSVTAVGTVLAASSSKGSPIGTFVLLAVVLGLAYLFILRPNRNRQRAAVSARGKAEVGDEVTTTAGLIATVVAIDDDAVTLEVAPGVRSRYLPQAIVKVNQPPEPAPVEEDDEGESAEARADASDIPDEPAAT